MDNNDQIRNTLAFQTVTPVNIKGKPAKRFMSVYRTVGCAYNQCTMCDFKHYADPNITDDNLIEQHKQSLKQLKEGKYSQFDLLTLGNFFNDYELSPKIRKHFLKSLAKIKTLKRILVESRRSYVTLEKLNECKGYLRNDQILEFGLGYESSNDYIRNTLLKKQVPEKHLDQSIEMCKKAGVDFVSYVLIKPHLLSESDGIRDSVDTVMHILSKAKKQGVYARICFEPVFVTYKTPIEEHWKKGDYEPLQLWSIAKVIIDLAKKLKETNTKGKFFLGLSDENLSSERFSHNCGVCDINIKSGLQEYNAHQDIKKIDKLYHCCKEHWKKVIEGGEVINEYVDASSFLGMHHVEDKVRIACKNFFVKKLEQNASIGLSLEQMGKCTDIIWHCSEEEQKQYYPFMDKLNTELKIVQMNYTEKDIHTSETNNKLKDLRIIDRLKIGMVINRGGNLITINPFLLTQKHLPIKGPKYGKELKFSKKLEDLYQKSLAVRICTKD